MNQLIIEQNQVYQHSPTQHHPPTHILLTCTPNSLPNTQPHNLHYLLRTNPIPNFTPDQSWPKLKHTNPIYAIKMASRGFQNCLTFCVLFIYLSILIYFLSFFLKVGPNCSFIFSNEQNLKQFILINSCLHRGLNPGLLAP